MQKSRQELPKRYAHVSAIWKVKRFLLFRVAGMLRPLDGKLQRAVQESMVAGLSTRNYRRAVESVLEGYGIEKSSVSGQFMPASSNQLRILCERRLGRSEPTTVVKGLLEDLLDRGLDR